MEEDKPGRDIGIACIKDGIPVVKALKVEFHVSRPKSSWQQQRVIKHLKEMYPDGNFPSPKRLLAKLAKRDPNLKSLDWKTLRQAISRIKT